MAGKIRFGEGGSVRFFCPGCADQHIIQIGEGPGPRWSYNGDVEAPTFSPSVNVEYNGADAGIDGAPPRVCHSIITDGNIQFQGDCTHELVGQTVDLPEWRRR